MMYNLPAVYPFSFLHNYVEFSVYLIGCGGTGGYVAPHIARLAAVASNINSVTFIDFDTVEERNLERQNFIRADLGRNKAIVLARRYSMAFGVPISYSTEPVDSPEKLPGPKLSVLILVSCVDNHYTRARIVDFVRSYPHSVVLIDAGNELYSGHVSLGFLCSESRTVLPVLDNVSSPQLFSLPLVTDIFPEILAASNERPAFSCAEQAQGDPQAISANLTAATLVTNYLYALVSKKPIYSHLVMFDVLNNAMETRLNTIDNLTAHMRSCPPSQPFEMYNVPSPALVST